MTTSPLEAARRLAPLIRENAEGIEAARELPRPLFEALADAGLFQMALPRSIGGLEIDLPAYLLVMEELGKADASTAWVVNQGGLFGAFAAPRLPLETAREIWSGKPRSVASNTPIPSARATVVPGGYRVSGRMGFSSGCRHASWMAAYAQVFDGDRLCVDDQGKPAGRYLMVPMPEAVIHDTWHVSGMRGTGTHHVEVKDVFVREERTYLREAPPREEGPLYRIKHTLLYGVGDTAICLGTARSCLEAFAELAGAKTPRAMPNVLREQAMVQQQVGQCEALIRSSRAFIIDAVNNIWNESVATGKVSQDRRAELRLAIVHGIRHACQAVDIIYNAAGVTGLNKGSLIQRYFQDIHVMTQHAQARLSYYEMTGRFWLGLPVPALDL